MTALRRLVGQYTIARHNTAALPTLIFSDSASSEVLTGGTLDIRRDGTFTLVYVIRTRMLLDATKTEDRTELTGRVMTSSEGVRFDVTSNNGEALEEAWQLITTAGSAGRLLMVVFDDGTLDAVQFRRR